MNNSTELWHKSRFIKLLPVILMNSPPTSSSFLFNEKLTPRERLIIFVFSLHWCVTTHKNTAWLLQFLCFLQLPKWIRQDWLQDWLHFCISKQETTENNSCPHHLSDTSRETWYGSIFTHILPFRKTSREALKASHDENSATCVDNVYLNWE